MPSRNPKRVLPGRAAGFTLLEVIIALSLSSLVALLGALLVRTATDYYARGNAFLDQQEQTRHVLRLFNIVGPGLAVAGAQFVGKADSLELMTDKLPLGLNLPGKQRVRLQCEAHEPGLRLVLRVIAPALDAKPSLADDKRAETYLFEKTLNDKLVECAFDYLRLDQEKDRAAVGRWEPEWLKDFKDAPKAVRLSLATPQYKSPPFVIATAP